MGCHAAYAGGENPLLGGYDAANDDSLRDSRANWKPPSITQSTNVDTIITFIPLYQLLPSVAVWNPSTRPPRRFLVDELRWDVRAVESHGLFRVGCDWFPTYQGPASSPSGIQLVTDFGTPWPNRYLPACWELRQQVVWTTRLQCCLWIDNRQKRAAFFVPSIPAPARSPRLKTGKQFELIGLG